MKHFAFTRGILKFIMRLFSLLNCTGTREMGVVPPTGAIQQNGSLGVTNSIVLLRSMPVTACA